MILDDFVLPTLHTSQDRRSQLDPHPLMVFHLAFESTHAVREYWRIFVFVSFLHGAIKNWVFLPQISIIDTRQAKKKLNNKIKIQLGKDFESGNVLTAMIFWRSGNDKK